jgi:hypothetical protein
MKSTTEMHRLALKALCVSALVAMAGQSYAQQPVPAKKTSTAVAPKRAVPTESEIRAHTILKRMADFVSGAQRFSVSLRAGYDAVQKSGQKIEFGENRKITLSRPDRMRVEGERSDGAKTVTVFDGKQIILIDAASNVYATAPQPGGLDDSIVHFVRDLGMRLPLAVLLVSRLGTEFEGRIQSLDYVEKTSLYGAASHHLAGRTDTVDFQVWVADGDKPLPQRVVITYKKAPGQPQFWGQFSDWNLAPAIADSTFAVKPPDGAQKVAFAAQLPRVSPGARKPAADKGAK